MRFVSVIIPSYRSFHSTLRTVDALLHCDQTKCDVELLVIDDGSADGTADALRSSLVGKADVIAHANNRGRSAARNTGLEAASGDLVLFIDADCIPCSNDFLTRHLFLATGGVCSAGPVASEGAGFWNLYQKRVERRRRNIEGMATFTSANFMVARKAMRDVGGFDIAFRGYGFEDRELALRLQATGIKTIFNAEAGVSHEDTLDLSTVCAKMVDAGAGNSALFAERHPVAYRALGYAAADARLHPSLRAVHALCEPLRIPAIRHAERLLESRMIPFASRAALARALASLSFLHGTAIA
jgi:glycosyltransferase involved in cell wall biosynthesis